MLAIDNSPSNPNTHHSHSSYPSQMEDFSTEVISLANSEMTIESRYQAAAAATTPSTPPQLQEQLQLQEQPPLTKISSQSKASTPSVSTSALKKASSLFKLNTNSQSRNKKHTNKQQQQQSQPSSTSPKTLTNITSRQSTPTPTPTPSNSTSRPNLRSLLRIGSFSNNQPHIHSNNPHVKNPSITALEGEIEVKIDEEDIEEEDNIEEEDDEIAYLSDLESDLNYDPKAEESHEDYRTGGYHPVSKGEIYYSKKLPNREYIILRKLGWGHFSTVWLAKSRYNGNLSLEKEEEDDEKEEEEVEESLLDLVDINEYYVAIKFVKSNKNYMEAARDEIKIMNVLNDPINNNHHIPKENISYFKNDNKLHPGYNHVMQLKDDFEISGPNGIHICMVFEILGENVLNLIYRYKRLYRSINSEIKRKESAEENICLQQQLQMKFSKWDTKNWKKSTKSMLSLGLHNKKDTHKHDSTSNNNNNDTNNNFTINHNNNTNTNGQASINTTAISTASSSSLNSNPHEDSFIESSGSGSNSVSGSGSGSGSGQDNESTTTVDSWEDDLDKKIKSLNSQSLIKLIETSKTVGGIPLYIVKQIVKQMLLAIDYMHHCGIIHTDLKPENILIDIKDINKLIRTIEDEKLSKFRANNNNNLSRSRKASLLSNCSRTRRRRSLSKQLNQHYQLQQQQQQKSNCCSSSCHIRTLSTTSNSSQSSYFYKKLKNSIVGKYESPIRCSKPLSSSISSDSIFKDVNFNGNDSNNHSNNKPRKKSISKAISPRNFSFFDYNKKDQEMIDDNIEEEEQQQREGEGNIRGGISIKIADLGNATFVDEHFTNQIQTRQYRSPEIILKYKHWGSLTDLWSIGCIIFELITGDFLFDPHDGKCFDKDEDHLAQIVELLGDFPNDEYLLDCKLTGKFFKLNPNPDLKGNLQIMFKNIDQLKIWKLKDVLIEKYKFNKNDYEVDLICDLILKCLKYDLNERYDANSLLKHPWFDNDSDNNSTISPGLEDRLKSLPNCHDDLPGYTCECKI